MRAYLDLMRLPLVTTAIANVIAGYYLAHGPGEPTWWRLALAALVSACLYTGGMILNDVFDAPRDKARGRDRPITTGRISRTTAAVLGASHVIAGIALSVFLGRETAFLTGLTAAFVLAYNGIARRPAWLGATMMSAARGANVLIGVGAGGSVAAAWNVAWFDASPTIGMPDPGEIWLHPLAIFVYTFAVTLESLREDHLGEAPYPRLPFDFAYYAVPAAIFGSLMCDDHSPFTQIFWIFPVLLAFANGRAYARQPSTLSARRTVRDGLLCMPCMDAIVVSTVIAVNSRLHAVMAGIAVAGLGILAYILMRLMTPKGRIPTADDALEQHPQSVETSKSTRFHIEERSTNHLAKSDGTFIPGGTWHVLRCQIPAKAPTRFLLGISERDPERPQSATIRLRAIDAQSAAGLADALALVVALAVPAPTQKRGAGWVDLRATLIASGVARRAAGDFNEDEPGDWELYEARWHSAAGGRYLTFNIGVNEIAGLGEISAGERGTRADVWRLFLEELWVPEGKEHQ